MRKRNIKVPPSKLPSLKAIRVFDAAGKYGSFTVAAERLYVTQSAVSKQISILEDELGCRLFVRDKNGVRLTDIGQEYHCKISHSLSDIAIATEELRLRNIGLNVIRLTTLPTLAMHWLLPRLPDLRICHPEITMDVSSSNELTDLTSGAIHAAIRFGLGTWPDLKSEYLFDEELVTVCSQQYLHYFKRDFASAIQQATLLHTTTRPDAWVKWSNDHSIKIDIPEVVGFQDFFITIQAAILGQGVAIVPSFLVQNELSEGRLFDPTGLRTKSERSYYFVTNEENSQREPIIQLKNWLIQASASKSVSESSGALVM